MTKDEMELLKKLRLAEEQLAKAIKTRNDGMTAYRHAYKVYQGLMNEAARRLMEKK